MARYCQAIHGHQAIHGWPGPSADGLGPPMAPNKAHMGEDLQYLEHVLLVFPERREANLDAIQVSSSKGVQKRAEHVVGEVLEGRRALVSPNGITSDSKRP